VALDYIKLVDSAGEEDNAAFMRFKQELWSDDRKRLTLLVDPGRIKRNVSTNLELGPALRSGGRYSLKVKKGWPTANGGRQLEEFTRFFTVTDALRVLPDTAKWQFTLPSLYSKKPLTIQFDRPFDRHLLKHAIALRDESGEYLKGKVRVSGNETLWRFFPARPWQSNDLYAVVDAYLEDVAGNNFKDLLDHPVSESTAFFSSVEVALTLPENEH